MMIDKFEKNHFLLNSVAVAIAFYSGHGAAAGEGSDFRLEEVMVTAQKRSESLQDVPIALSAFSGDTLKDLGVNNIKDIQAVTPNFVVNNTGAIAQPYLRGIGTRLSNMGLEPSIATYIDDRYISRPAATLFELADVERIEILKGPQGTLYGRNAAGGAVRVVTMAPADELEGLISAGIGNYDSRSLSGTASVPLSDTVKTRFSAMTKQRDGYADNLSPLGVSELDDQDFQAYRAKLQWNMTDDASMLLSVGYFEQDDNNGNDVVALPPYDKNRGIDRGGVTGLDPDEVGTAIDLNIDSDELSAQLRFDIAFEGVDFAAMTTYSDWNNNTRPTDGDGTSAAVLDVTSATEDSETYSQELQLLSNSDGDWDWLAGVYFYHQEGNSNIMLDVGASSLASLQNQSVDTDAWSIFGQTTWQINDTWALTLGGRWNDEEKDVSMTEEPGTIMAGGTAGKLPFDDNESWSEFTPKATLEYSFDAGMAYLTYSRGFKSGGFNYPAVANEPLDPEILDMYELGYKADLLEGSLRLNAALFYYDYQDLQVTRAGSGEGGSITLTTENAADAEVLGFEFDVNWLATEYLTLSAGAGFLDSEYQDYDASAKVFLETTAGMTDVFFDASGESLLRAPDTSAYVSAKYEFSAGDATVPVVLTYSYKDEYDFDFIASEETDAIRQDAYGLLSARISYQSPNKDWSVALWGSNLTDEEYFDDIVANSAGIRGSYGVPRTYGVEGTYNF